MRNKIVFVLLCCLPLLCQAKVAPLAVIQGQLDAQTAIYPSFTKFAFIQALNSHSYATLDFYPTTQGYYELYAPAEANSDVLVDLVYNNSATNSREPQCRLHFHFDSKKQVSLQITTLPDSMVSCHLAEPSSLDIVMEDVPA